MVDRNAASVFTLLWNTGDAVMSEAKLSLAFFVSLLGVFVTQALSITLACLHNLVCSNHAVDYLRLIHA